jgi:hypothetical protein
MRAHPLPEARTLRRPDAARAAQGHPVVPARVDLADRGGRAGAATWRPTARRWSELAAELFPAGDPGRPSAPRRRSRSSTSTPRREVKTVAAMLYPTPRARDPGEDRVRAMSVDERLSVVRAYVGDRTNRRHKPGRALERIDYRFDVLSRLRRVPRPAAPPHDDHRVAALTPATATPVPSDRRGRAGRACSTRRWTRSAAVRATCRSDFPEQAAYAVSLAYRIRYVHAVQRPRGDAPARAAVGPRRAIRATDPSHRRCTAVRRGGRSPRIAADDDLRRPQR